MGELLLLQISLLLRTVQVSCIEEIFQITVQTIYGSETITYDRNPLYLNCYSNYWEHECRFYGECCSNSVRVREVLEPETYECQNFGNTQGYVVKSCPSGTDEKLASLCEHQGADLGADLSILSWPVSGAYTGITYKNVYCAMCNGALTLITDNDLSGIFDPQLALEFWTIEVYCTNSTIEMIEQNLDYFLTPETLENLLEDGLCWKRALPTSLGIHHEGCGNYVAHCPVDYPEGDLKELCVRGPTNEVCLNQTLFDRYPCRYGSYKNVFCKKCWKNQSPTVLEREVFDSEGLLLMNVQPIVHIPQNETEFDDSNFRIPLTFERNLTGVTNDDILQYYPLPSDQREEEPFWNLGSILCKSNLSRVCGEFIAYPKEGECALPGCGTGRVQDLYNNCTSIDRYIYDTDITLNRSFLWADSLLAKILSTCESDEPIKNCNCDQRCHYFGDCCFDAPLLPGGLSIAPFSQSQWSCYNIFNLDYNGQVVIDSCPDSLSPFNTLCTSGSNQEWDLTGWLVSDLSNGLTYKNVYCAQCNNASDVVFWDALMNCPEESGEIRGLCEFQKYIPPPQYNIFYYPCILNVEFVSSCPKIFEGWKINQDCKTKPASFVYSDSTTYRNFYCYICHLGTYDDSAIILPNATLPSRASLSITKLQEAGQEWASKTSVRFSFDSGICCGKCKTDDNEQCQNFDSEISADWGSLSLSLNDTCISVPFDSECSHEKELSTSAINPSFEFLCPGVTIACFLTTTTFGSFGIAGINPTPAPRIHYTSFSFQTISTSIAPPQVVRGFLADDNARKNPAGVVKTAETWVRATNETYLFCPDKTVIGNNSGSRYNDIILAPGKIFVKDIVNVTRTRKSQRGEFADYEYAFIGLSLTSIILYLIFLAVTKRNRFTIADKMMVGLLVSIFGASISFAFIVTPSPDDVIGCSLVGYLTQFFFLASLTWSNSLTISILKTLHTLSVHRESKWQMLFYTLYSFGFPLLCVIITYILSRTDIEAFEDGVLDSEFLCFIGEIIVLYALFLGPAYALMLFNIIAGIIIMAKVTKSGNIGSSKDKNRFIRKAVSCLKISLLLGLGWILLPLAIAFDPVWSAVQVYVELQGVFIVIGNLIGWSCLRKLKERITPSMKVSSNQTEATQVTLTHLHQKDSQVAMPLTNVYS
ncbi:uncharacterized protein [Watersipora subatra]|uniref:uncharacterized protein n=1 Tax=Watersipora subatra TaxID=2589382 RepID=UPI00355BFBCD